MILLTGASGFIGEYLLSALIANFGKENILALSSERTHLCQFLPHNSYSFDKSYFIDSGFQNIQTIIHAGAFTPKDAEQSNDWHKCNSNILNTDALLKAEFPTLTKIIYLSTLDVYCKSTEKISEETFIRPVSLYGDSKFYCERMITEWAKSNDKIAQVLRIGHVYGAGEERYNKIIPLTMKNLLQNKPLQIWGSGEELRSFIHVQDVVTAILKSLTLDEEVGPVNIVGAQEISINNLVKLLIAVSGLSPELIFLENITPQRDLTFDAAKLKKYLLANERSLIGGLKEEWEYMKRNFE